ncbi:MAG: leucine-rich repeat protein [Clostridiales bacterium]|nr:leucine-rich repeat protein [Clostridiales bacterium]
MTRNLRPLLSAALSALLLTGCAAAPAETVTAYPCQVVLKEGEGFQAEDGVCSLTRGEDAVFCLTAQDGYTVTGADYEDYTLTFTGTDYTLTLHNVRYSTVVTVTAEQTGVTILYDANGGVRLDGEDAAEPVAVAVTPSHLRVNTSTGVTLFGRTGYTLTGWNTQPDGSGIAVGLGSRVVWTEGLTLYAQWSQWTAADCFTYARSGEGVVITGYRGTEDVLTIPAELDGYTVYAVGEDACAGASCTTVVLPQGLQRVEAEAFAGSSVETVYLSDDIVSVSDYAFQSCPSLTTLHINAVEAPVYSVSYYATFQDKFDRLLSLEGEAKLVLFSGSSTRFGYDSAALEAAFPDYQVVNMGVFAYTNALPQLLLILDCMEEGDILLHAPEFDTVKRQFCTSASLDAAFFCMMEANYDTVARLDLREVGQVFTALTSYLTAKEGMEAKSYALSPWDFDEDGSPTDTPSYNEYGDYILYRPNADSDEPVYGLEVGYTVADFPQSFLDSLNSVYQRFLNRGISVYFTYAPRNCYAISQDSTPEARAALDEYLREGLCVPVISDLEESLYPGRYLYGTDNHLSTEGVQIRTARIIADLQAQLEKEAADE